MIREAPCARRCLTTRQQQLVEDNLGLAYLYSRRWSSPSIGSQELLGAASEALCHAALAWCPARGTFAKYASVVVNNALVREVQLLSRLVHLPRDVHRQLRRCAERYDPGLIPTRLELMVVLERQRLGAQQYQHFRNAWFVRRPRKALQEVL